MTFRRAVVLVAGVALLAGCATGGGEGSEQGGDVVATTLTEPTTTVSDVALPYEAECDGSRSIAHRAEGVAVVEAMREWCGTDADFDDGPVETVEDCARMVSGAELLTDLVDDFPDAQLRASLQGLASLVRTSAQQCVDEGNTFALMGMMGATAFVAEMDVRFAELGVEMVEADGTRMGYQP